MTTPVPATDEQLMTCFAAYHVAEHARRQWRVDTTSTLITAIKQLPTDIDATPLIEQAHQIAGDMWTLMSNNGAAPSYRTGTPLAPATALAALRGIAGVFLMELMDYTPGLYDPQGIDALRNMDALSVQEKINGYRDSVELRGTQSADLAMRIETVLAEIAHTSEGQHS